MSGKRCVCFIFILEYCNSPVRWQILEWWGFKKSQNTNWYAKKYLQASKCLRNTHQRFFLLKHKGTTQIYTKDLALCWLPTNSQEIPHSGCFLPVTLCVPFHSAARDKCSVNLNFEFPGFCGTSSLRGKPYLWKWDSGFPYHKAQGLITTPYSC